MVLCVRRRAFGSFPEGFLIALSKYKFVVFLSRSENRTNAPALKVSRFAKDPLTSISMPRIFATLAGSNLDVAAYFFGPKYEKTRCMRSGLEYAICSTNEKTNPLWKCISNNSYPNGFLVASCLIR